MSSIAPTVFGRSELCVLDHIASGYRSGPLAGLPGLFDPASEDSDTTTGALESLRDRGGLELETSGSGSVSVRLSGMCVPLAAALKDPVLSIGILLVTADGDHNETARIIHSHACRLLLSSLSLGISRVELLDSEANLHGVLGDMVQKFLERVPSGRVALNLDWTATGPQRAVIVEGGAGTEPTCVVVGDAEEPLVRLGPDAEAVSRALGRLLDTVDGES